MIIGTSRIVNIDPNASWTQNGVIVAGSNISNDYLNKFAGPFGFYIDDDKTIYIADLYARRVVEWKCGATDGFVAIGGNETDDMIDDLGGPTGVIIDKQTDSLIICDWINQRVVRWPRRNGIEGKTLISNIHCWGVAMDNDGVLYVSDTEKNEVRQWRMGDTDGRVVAGGNGKGDSLNQLDFPRHLFIDQDHALYVADCENHRVMKWARDAKEGIVVAGGNGRGSALTQLDRPQGVIVDQHGTVYVADCSNHRIVRWSKDTTEGNIVVGAKDPGEQEHELEEPMCLSFDLRGNLYVADFDTNSIRRFSLIERHSY